MSTAIIKKTATKKVVAKKATPKKKAHTPKVMVESPAQESFWVTDGQILNSLRSLCEALQLMQNDVYAYHVTKDRNDFADWVEAVLKDTACAADLRKAKTPKSACTVVVKHLKFYA